MRGKRLAWCVATIVATAATVRADEGMWLFNAPPLAVLETRHGFVPPAGWLDHLQRSAVRFSSGGSGSFVSPDGLVLTNHHVAADALQKLGREGRDLYRDGFHADRREDELACEDLELNVLESIEDVTARVEAAAAGIADPEEAFAARRRVMAEIEQESLARTGLRSDVVTLFQGGAYHLYRAKQYTDVRLVFAPERQIAFFGGDADNFEFPRFDLDICFFRAYEGGVPARVPHHLEWSSVAVRPDDLVFVAGHPGHTDRGVTVAELLALRDVRIPFDIRSLNRLETLYASWSQEGPEELRQASHDLFGVQNGRKARQGILGSLLDPRILERKRQEEDRVRPRLAADHAGTSALERIEKAQQELDTVMVRQRLLEGGTAFNTPLFRYARMLLRAAEETPKPSGERLREYRDSNRRSLELQLFSPEPLHPAFETVKLADSLTFLATLLGPDDETVRAVLAGRSPADRAGELVAGTSLGNRVGPAGGPDKRRELYEGGAAAVAASDDSMLALARLVDEESRRLRRIVESTDEVKRQAHAEITRARRLLEGDTLYPDATFTLRLAFGTVRGYDEAGARIEPVTTFAGLFGRVDAKDGQPPFDLPGRWADARGRLQADADFMETPFNFVSTADIIGGNSGSPVVDRQGRLVGLIFDGNIQSLVADVAFDDQQGRAVAVATPGILAALEEVYAAHGLVEELRAGETVTP